MIDHTIATHHVMDVMFPPELAMRARTNLTRTGSPFPITLPQAASYFIRQPRHEQTRLVEMWRTQRAASIDSVPESDAPVWCVDLESRELVQVHALGLIHGLEEFDELIGFVAALSMQFETPRIDLELSEPEPRTARAPLVLLDLDQTLLDFSKCYREGVFDFIVELSDKAPVGIWSASSLGRVVRIGKEIQERTGVEIATLFSIDHTTSPLYYDHATGQLDRYQGTIAHRKELALLDWMRLDPTSTLLIDDGREHWSGQYNQIAVMPKPPLADMGEVLDLDAVWSALLDHVGKSLEHPDVRLAPRFYWRPEWFEEQRRMPEVLVQREATLVLNLKSDEDASK